MFAIMTHNKEWRGLSEIHTVKSTSIFNANRNWRFKPYKTIVLNRSWKRTCIPNKKRQPILKPSTLPKIRLMSRLEVFYLGPPLSLFRTNIFECIWPPRERSYINCSSTWLLGQALTACMGSYSSLPLPLPRTMPNLDMAPDKIVPNCLHDSNRNWRWEGDGGCQVVMLACTTVIRDPAAPYSSFDMSCSA